MQGSLVMGCRLFVVTVCCGPQGSCVMCCVLWVKRWAGIDGNTIKNDGGDVRDSDDNGRMADECEVAQLEIDRAQAHSLGFQNLKPEPEALSSCALGLGLAGLSRAGFGLQAQACTSLSITTLVCCLAVLGCQSRTVFSST